MQQMYGSTRFCLNVVRQAIYLPAIYLEVKEEKYPRIILFQFKHNVLVRGLTKFQTGAPTLIQ